MKSFFFIGIISVFLGTLAAKFILIETMKMKQSTENYVNPDLVILEWEKNAIPSTR